MSAACWRMMSSWRSGSVTSRNASSTSSRLMIRRRGDADHDGDHQHPGAGQSSPSAPRLNRGISPRNAASRSATLPSLPTTWVALTRLLVLPSAGDPREPRDRPFPWHRPAALGSRRRRRSRSWRRRRPPVPPRTAAAPRPRRRAWSPVERLAPGERSRSPTSGCSVRLEPGELLRVLEDDLADPGAVDGPPSERPPSPQRSTSRSRTRSSASSSWTTASVESVAAPSRPSAASASDLPAAIAPVRPTNGIR